jgi:copper chaperone
MVELQVNGMTCGHCVSAVTQAVQSVDPAARVDVELTENRVRIESDAPVEKLQDAVNEAGYEVVGSKRL